jgi:hypothetical protein
MTKPAFLIGEFAFVRCGLHFFIRFTHSYRGVIVDLIMLLTRECPVECLVATAERAVVALKTRAEGDLNEAGFTTTRSRPYI